MASLIEIVNILRTLSGIYGEEPASAEGYYWTLGDIDPDILEDAAKLHVRRNKWFPKPSELREAAEEIRISKEREQEKVITYWRMCARFGDMLAGRMPEAETRVMRVVDEYFSLSYQPDIPVAPPDTRSDAELEREFQAWKRANNWHYTWANDVAERLVIHETATA